MLSFYLSMVETEEDRSLIEELYIKYEQAMYNSAIGILHNKYDAEDAVQEAFLRIINNIEKIKKVPADERGYYIVIISRNSSINYLRKKERRKEIPIEDVYETQDDTSTEDLAESEYGVENIKHALLTLADTDFEVLNMSLIHGFTNKEISEMLGIADGAVRQRLYKAKKNLKKALEKENYYE